MRAAVQTKKSKRGLKILVAVILILGVLALAFKFVLYDKLKDKAFDMVRIRQRQLQPRAAFRNEGNISEICKVEIYC